MLRECSKIGKGGIDVWKIVNRPPGSIHSTISLAKFACKESKTAERN